jgi:hypothetical protein
MTQDEIIQMLRASCDKDRVDPEQNGFWVIVTDELVAFANLVAQHEREACAIVCDDINAKYKWPDDVAERVASQWCADSIRARGQA